MHQTGMIAARGQHFGNHVLLADVAVGNVLDGDAGSNLRIPVIVIGHSSRR